MDNELGYKEHTNKVVNKANLGQSEGQICKKMQMHIGARVIPLLV